MLLNRSLSLFCNADFMKRSVSVGVSQLLYASFPPSTQAQPKWLNLESVLQAGKCYFLSALDETNARPARKQAHAISSSNTKQMQNGNCQFHTQVWERLWTWLHLLSSQSGLHFYLQHLKSLSLPVTSVGNSHDWRHGLTFDPARPSWPGKPRLPGVP